MPVQLSSLKLPISALSAGFEYLKRNPAELVFVAKHAAGLRAAVPMDLLRWLLARVPTGKNGLSDVVIGHNPPALTFESTVSLMGAKVRAGAHLRIEEVRMGGDELRLVVRLSDVRLEPLGPPDSPLAAMLKSPMLDLSKPANLLNFMPKRPPALVEAKDDRVVLDLMKTKLGKNRRLKQILSVVSPLVEIRDLRAEDDHLVVEWRPRAEGVTTAVAALRSEVLS
ncbi:MAG: hypothetical protein HY698_22360 [Deltaproteobacteria bacterium]|nr:hypothetical protein [Deltaproteobacteria bacterium]